MISGVLYMYATNIYIYMWWGMLCCWALPRDQVPAYVSFLQW